MRLLLLPWFFMLAAYAGAQPRFQYPTQLTEEEGLLNNYVTALEEDSEGFLWVGTYVGLCRFDGARFQTLSKPNTEGVHNNFIFDLQRDRRGRMWVSSAEGISRYERSSLQPQKVLTNTHPEQEGGEWFNVMYEDRQGNIWTGSNLSGLCKYDTIRQVFHCQSFTLSDDAAQRAVNHLYAIAQDARHDSIFWLGTRGGLVRYNVHNQQFKWFPLDSTLKQKHTKFPIANAVLSHTDGKIYVGSWGGMVAFDPTTQRFQLIFEISESTGPREFTFKAMGQDQLWLSYDRGLVIYNTATERVTNYYRNNLKENRIYGATLIDRQGRIWARSAVGLFLFNPLLQQFKTYTTPTANAADYSNLTRGMLESADGQRLYVYLYEGDSIWVFNRQNETWTAIPPPPGYVKKGSFKVRDMLRLRDGQLLVLEINHLYRFWEKERRWQRIPLKNLPSNMTMQNVLEDRNGTLWISTRRGGVLRVHPQTWQVQQYKELFNIKGFAERANWTSSLYEDRQGNLWISANPGFSIYDLQRDTFLHFVENDEIPFSFVQDNQGFMWVSVFNRGLYQYDPQHLEKGVLKKYSIKNGLIDYPLRMVKDRQGTIWFAHSKGITAFDPARGTFRHFDKGYNFPTEISNENERMELLSTGEILLATTTGFCLFQPAGIQVNSEVPRPYLTSFRIFDREIASEAWKANHRWNLSYQQNFFSFEFSAIAYHMPDAVQFAYQLVGVDKDWIQAGKRHYASYTNIPGGNYTFQVKAANSEGVWSTQFASVQIHMSIPWWRTGWFWALLALALGGAVFGFYTWRIREFRKQEKLKIDFERKLADVKMNALRAQINPHFIFNCLNSIDYYIIKNESQKASEYLNQFSRLIRLILQNSSANFVLLKDELEALQLYMQMESMRFNHRFDYEVKVEKDLPLDQLEIPPMLLQPYVENAIWHGLMPKNDKGCIEVAITRENGYLHCVIEDNGIGREKAELFKSSHHSTKKRSMGMAITQNRIELLNQQLGTHTTVHIIDLKDGDNRAIGTRVELNIPIHT